MDDLRGSVVGEQGQELDCSFVVIDIETTGFSPISYRIIEVNTVKVENGKSTDQFSTFVNPEVNIPFEIEKLTGINDEMV